MKRWLQSALSLIVLISFLWIIATQRSLIIATFQQVSGKKLLAVFLLMFPAYPLTVLAWQTILRGLGTKVEYRKAFSIWMIGNTARFLPAGSVWQWVSRAYAAEAHGISKGQTLLSSAYEVAFLVLSSFIVIVVTLPFWPTPVAIPWWVAVVASVAAVGLWPKTLPWLMARYGQFRKQSLPPVPQLPWKTVAIVLGLGIVRSITNGLALWLLVSFFTPLTVVNSIWMIGAYRFAWLIGYLTVFAPAGLGVADTVLASLLTGPLGFGAALGIALIYRSSNLLNELANLLIAIAFNPKILNVIRKQTTNGDSLSRTTD